MTRLELSRQREIARNIIRQIRNVWIDLENPLKTALEMERIAFTSYSTGEQLPPKSQWKKQTR